MSHCFFIAPLYWDLWSGRFRAADSDQIAGVIPSNFQYHNLFQSKFISVHAVSGLYIYTKFYQYMSTTSDPVVDYSHVRGWSFPRGLSRGYEPILYHHEHKSTADKALTVHFFFYFLMAWVITSLLLPYIEIFGDCRFRAADSFHIAAVICVNFQYDNLFQLKLILAHWVKELYICTKFYQGMSTMSDPVVVYSHVMGWSFPRGLSRCYKPILYHEKMHIALR